ncbi:MAG: hypothetical protein U1E14_10590 [Geminicoccaceae bacterium]
MSSASLHGTLAALSLVVAALPIPAAAAPPDNCDKCFAIVTVDGTLAAKRNITANYRHATGTYEIVFRYPVNKCVVTAQIEETNASSTIGRFSQVGNPANRSITIYTIAPDGGPRGSGFGIYVQC